MSETPRTDKQAQLDAAQYYGHGNDYVSLVKFTRELERESDRLTKQCVRNVEEIGTLRAELNELKGRHKTAITECTQYTPEEWKDACKYAEPCAVWLDGKQMTRLMKDKARFEWLLKYATRGASYIQCMGFRVKNRETIDAAMEAEQS